MIRLRELREMLNIKQSKVAEKIGKTAAAYSRYENEQLQMDYETLINVASYFDVSIDYLLGRTENKRFLASIDENEKGFVCSADEKELVLLYRQLSNEQKQFARGFLAGGISLPISSPNKKAVALPVTAGISRKNIKNIQKKEG